MNQSRVESETFAMRKGVQTKLVLVIPYIQLVVFPKRVSGLKPRKNEDISSIAVKSFVKFTATESVYVSYMGL